MYCQKCGCRIHPKEEKCPNCGSDAKPEYCGGFWGLVGVENEQKQQKPPVQKNDTVPEKREEIPVEDPTVQIPELPDFEDRYKRQLIEARKRRQKDRKVIRGFAIGTTLLFLICITLGAFILMRLNQVVPKEEYAKVEKEYNNVKEKNEQIKKDKAQIEKENEQVKKENRSIAIKWITVERRYRLHLFKEFVAQYAKKSEDNSENESVFGTEDSYKVEIDSESGENSSSGNGSESIGGTESKTRIDLETGNPIETDSDDNYT